MSLPLYLTKKKLDSHKLWFYYSNHYYYISLIVCIILCVFNPWENNNYTFLAFDIITKANITNPININIFIIINISSLFNFDDILLFVSLILFSKSFTSLSISFIIFSTFSISFLSSDSTIFNSICFIYFAIFFF